MVQRLRESGRRFGAAAGLERAGLAWLAVALAVVVGSLLVLGAAAEDVVRGNGLQRSDALRLQWFVVHRPDAAVALARFLAVAASPTGLAVLAVASGAWLWRRGSHLVVAAAPVLALAVAATASTTTKVLVGRQRPPLDVRLITETAPSFPSGHATDSTAVFVTIALVVAVTVLRSPVARAGAVAGALALSGAVGLSRLTLGVHWPSDVIAGWALGLLVATLVATTAVLVARTQPDPTRPTEGWRRHAARLHDLARAERRKPLGFTAA